MVSERFVLELVGSILLFLLVAVLGIIALVHGRGFRLNASHGGLRVETDAAGEEQQRSGIKKAKSK